MTNTASLRELASLYPTDKSGHEHYLANYERHFGTLRNHPVRLLELGVHKGGSLQLWTNYFANGLIAGLDRNELSLESDRIRLFRGSQDDIELLDRIAAEVAPSGFDIIIDDCAHVGTIARRSFWHLFTNHLRRGGIYVIEDWGTGYWPHWPDGAAYSVRRSPSPPSWLPHSLGKIASTKAASVVPGARRLLQTIKYELLSRQFAAHAIGMVGFVKELVDECAVADITLPGWGVGRHRSSSIERMSISLGQVFVFKA